MADLALLVIVLLFLVWIGAALWNITGSGDAWDQVGSGHWTFDHPPADHGAPLETQAERDADLRGLLEARNDRRTARGLDALDVDAEMARFDALPAGADPGLEAEVRDVVAAKNARRVAAGKEPLDVEAEVRRLLEGG